jgi:hypothetical protein
MALAAKSIETQRELKNKEPIRAQAPDSKRSVTALDVATLEGSSRTGLYVKDRSGVRPLEYNEDPRGKELLARTSGITPEQAEDLKRQGTSIAYLREVPSPLGMTLGQSSENIYRGEHRIALGTEVVPYV